MVRDDAEKTTTYEAMFAPDSFGFKNFEIGQQFGFGICVNDGDIDTPGQKGWSGWGPHMIVFGQTAPDAALVTLTGNYSSTPFVAVTPGGAHADNVIAYITSIESTTSGWQVVFRTSMGEQTVRYQVWGAIKETF